MKSKIFFVYSYSNVNRKNKNEKPFQKSRGDCLCSMEEVSHESYNTTNKLRIFLERSDDQVDHMTLCNCSP